MWLKMQQYEASQRLARAHASWRWMLPNLHEKNPFEYQAPLTTLLAEIQCAIIDYPEVIRDGRAHWDYITAPYDGTSYCTITNEYGGENDEHWHGFSFAVALPDGYAFLVNYYDYDGRVVVDYCHMDTQRFIWMGLTLYGCFFIPSREVRSTIAEWYLYTDNAVAVSMPERVRDHLAQIWYFFLQTKPTLYNKEYVYSHRIRLSEAYYKYTDPVIGDIYIRFSPDSPSEVIEWVTVTKEETYRCRGERDVEIIIGNNIYLLGGGFPYLKCGDVYDILPALALEEEREYELRGREQEV